MGSLHWYQKNFFDWFTFIYIRLDLSSDSPTLVYIRLVTRIHSSSDSYTLVYFYLHSSRLVYWLVCVFRTDPIFLWCGKKWTPKTNYLLELIKRRSKVQEKMCHVNVLLGLTNEKHFPKSISQWEFDYGLFINLPIIISACDFSPSSFKTIRGILPLLTKYISWLESYLSYQAKIFLVN